MVRQNDKSAGNVIRVLASSCWHAGPSDLATLLFRNEPNEVLYSRINEVKLARVCNMTLGKSCRLCR